MTRDETDLLASATLDEAWPMVELFSTIRRERADDGNRAIAAIREKREPNASLQQLLPCMHVLGKLEQIIDPQRKAHA